MLVIDANVAIGACTGPGRFEDLGDELAAPPLMWSEARSILHLKAWTGEFTKTRAATMLNRLEAAPVQMHNPAELGAEAWSVADEFGWARTYDAEFVALAKILKCRLVTIDGRLRRGTDRLGFVITPDELRDTNEGPTTRPKPDR